MSGDGFLFDSGRILFRQNGREFSPNSIEGVVSVTAGSRGHGCRLGFANGSSMSIQWHDGAYCSNRFATMDPSHSFSPDAEIAIFTHSGEWYNFGSDTVNGWQSIDEVLDCIRQHSGGPVSAVA